MRDATPQFEALGAELTVISTGTPAQARAFRDAQAGSLRVLVDPERATYRALELRRSIAATFNMATVRHAWRAFKAGHRQGRTQGDPWQQGGVFVIPAGGGAPVFAYRSQAGGDHPDPEEIVTALHTQAPSNTP